MSDFLYHRRRILQTLGMGSLVGFLPNSFAAAAETGEPGRLPPLNRFPTMMQEWLMLQMRDAAPRVNEWKTKDEAAAYVSATRQRIRGCFGPMPEKTPLNPKVTGTLERDDYRVEKIVFESRPGFMVTGNLYVPKRRAFPLPAVVGLCGHSKVSKSGETYQSYVQGLVKQGYVVLIIDPVGQGERTQWNEGGGKSKIGGSTGEHIQMNNQMSLTGEFIGSWFAWDGIRALDYLLTRPEVDPKHLGVTGNSGGGTQAAWLAALEDRWTMAAPACFITSFRRNAENELPADSEQCPPDVLFHHLDHSDFIASMAPKPAILIAQEKDFFDVRGSMAAYQRLKNLYTALGEPENIQLHIGPDPHGYSKPNREAMYRFFNQATGISGAAGEPAVVMEKDEDLWCAPKGDVAELGSKLLVSFTAEKAEALAKQRNVLSTDALHRKVRELLRLSDQAGVPDYRILRSSGARSYPTKSYVHYALQTEPEIEVIVTRLTDETGITSRPPSGIKQALLYVSHRSADGELRSEAMIGDLMKGDADAAFYACDLRGIGESQPNTCGVDQFDARYGSHYFYAAHGVMLGRPLLGQRVFDVLRVIEWLIGCGHEEVHLAGNGWGALPAAFAALISGKVKQVSLKHALSSYGVLAADPDYQWPLALLLPGVLKHFDLPEVYAALQDKRLKSVEPWGARDGMKS